MAKFFFYLPAIALLSLTAMPAQAFRLGAGMAGVEEGDDRVRPALMLDLGINEKWYTQGFLYGREFGPVMERTTILSFGNRFPVFNRAFEGNIGVACLLEETTVKRGPNSDEDDYEKKQFNLGATFGIAYDIIAGANFVTLSWQSHVFLAGSAGLLLSTGRKHTFSLATGISI